MGGRGSGFENWGSWVLNVQQTEARSSGLRVSSVEFVFHMHNCRRRHRGRRGTVPHNLRWGDAHVSVPPIFREAVPADGCESTVSKTGVIKEFFVLKQRFFSSRKGHIYIIYISDFRP